MQGVCAPKAPAHLNGCVKSNIIESVKCYLGTPRILIVATMQFNLYLITSGFYAPKCGYDNVKKHGSPVVGIQHSRIVKKAKDEVTLPCKYLHQ
jgi:hypothetical protein